MANLKTRCDNASPLGLVRCDAEELLVIYDSAFILRASLGYY